MFPLNLIISMTFEVMRKKYFRSPPIADFFSSDISIDDEKEEKKIRKFNHSRHSIDCERTHAHISMCPVITMRI